MTDTQKNGESSRAADALFDALGGVGTDLVTDAHTSDARTSEAGKHRKGRLWRVMAPTAACFLLVTVGIFTYLTRMGWFGAACGSYPGTVLSDGSYWCLVPHDGIYVCRDGQARRAVSQFFAEQWAVNDEALYWKSGRSVYVLPHGEEKPRRLYTAGLSDCSHIAFALAPDGSLIVTIYNKYEKHLREVRVDGKTGEESEILTPTTAYRKSESAYSRTVWTLGERIITLRLREIDGWGTVGTLYENGEPLFDGGVSVGQYPVLLDGAIVFSGCASYAYEDNYTIVLRPDGNDSLITPADGQYMAWTAGDGDWLFCARDGVVCRANAYTGDVYDLTSDVPHEFCDLVYDSDRWLLYACEPWSGTTSLWRVVTEDGHPARLIQADDDILQ